MAPIDIPQDSEVPPLADMLYGMYSDDGLFFMANVLKQTIDFLPELYPNSNVEERKKQLQVLRLELITKFCQYAEDLAALALTFKSTHSNAKEEKIGLFKKIAGYGLSEIVDFYAHIDNRDVKYVAKFMGYPPLELQERISREIMEGSCILIKEEMTKIAKLYKETRGLYDAYKHGYRLFFGVDDSTGADAYAYVDSTGYQQAVVVNDIMFTQILSSINQCSNIVKMVLQSHNERMRYEESGTTHAIVKIQRLRRSSDPPMDPNQDLRLTYPTRGDKLKNEIQEGEEVYNLFKDELELNHNGKMVAIDMDEKKIIALDFDIAKVMETIRQVGSSGRMRIRRIGKNDATGVEIY